MICWHQLPDSSRNIEPTPAGGTCVPSLIGEEPAALTSCLDWSADDMMSPVRHAEKVAQVPYRQESLCLVVTFRQRILEERQWVSVHQTDPFSSSSGLEADSREEEAHG